MWDSNFPLDHADTLISSQLALRVLSVKASPRQFAIKSARISRNLELAYFHGDTTPYDRLQKAEICWRPLQDTDKPIKLKGKVVVFLVYAVSIRALILSQLNVSVCHCRQTPLLVSNRFLLQVVIPRSSVSCDGIPHRVSL